MMYFVPLLSISIIRPIQQLLTLIKALHLFIYIGR